LYRRCLYNVWVGKIKGPHLEEFSAPEATTESSSQILGTSFHNLLARVGLPALTLLELNDPPTNLPEGTVMTEFTAQAAAWRPLQAPR